ncbi:MAG: glycoside hydrolase family 15 protein [Candidatus Acidiferrales bacterium]
MSPPTERFFPPVTAAGLETQLPALRAKLEKSRTLLLEPGPNGIYTASASQTSDSASGYQNAWLRDNVLVAFSRWETGRRDSALETLRGLEKFLESQASKMEAIIAKPARKENIQRRPHVRFNARTLGELPESWAHAQNDALADVVWLRFLMANENRDKASFDLTSDELDLFRLFPLYFKAIEYWKDRDSGAWEEARKVNSSSVGTVVAALTEIERYLHDRKQTKGFNLRTLEKLIALGRRTLNEQLPFESPPIRRIDSALLLLVYPLRVLQEKEAAQMIVSLVRARLEGPYGIRRYVGDSYFCQDYDQWFPPEMRSADFSSRSDVRDEFLQPGREAQWCLFDSLLSAIYSYDLLQDSAAPFERQLYHFNRAIGQITPEGQCPELYYLRHGNYFTNDNTPLAWAQANLAIALHRLEQAGPEAARRASQR